MVKHIGRGQILNNFAMMSTVHPALTVQFGTKRDRVILGLPNFNIPYLSYPHAGFQNMARNC